MVVRQLIPEGLAEVAPGPELARVLGGIDLSRLSGFDCVQVLKAQYRQVNHERARLMAAMVEVGRCGIGPDELVRMPGPDEFSADEVRAALMLTRRAAGAQFWLANDLLSRLPAVHAAMDAGVLDEPRARVFSEWTTELSPEQARALCAELLPVAPGLTTGQLVEQIKKWAIALDPEWARRRYEQAVAERKVLGYRNPDGSANLSGCNLPVDRVAAASGHIDALAKAAKRAGDRRPIDHIRADLFLGMTDGTYTGLDDAEIVRQLLVAGCVDKPPENTGAEGEEQDGQSAGEPTPSGSSNLAAPSGAGLELRVRLSTLLGLDDYPAELAGWGPVHTEVARDLAVSLGGARWQFAITDEQGQLVCCGTTRMRPPGTPGRMASSRAIVELQIPISTLRDLDGKRAELGSWAEVVADLARQLDDPHTTQDRYLGDAHRRTPGAALRRYLEIRDRTCVMIGCRAPARGTDKDHTRDHGYGGLTTDDNLDDNCRHDHRLKHEGGWRLDQPLAGYFRWTSRLGHVYRRPPPPILEPLPDPVVRDQPPYPLREPVDTDWETSQIWTKPPEHEPPPSPPEPDPDEDIPPF